MRPVETSTAVVRVEKKENGGGVNASMMYLILL
jgi:hypothetical protein